MARNITILTIGSRGDIQPFVALGMGLQAAGFNVRIATYPYYQDLIESYGLKLSPVGGHPEELMGSKEGRRWLESYQNPVKFIRAFVALTKPHLDQMFADAVTACRGSDLIIYSLLGVAGYHVAEYFKIPAIAAYLQPFAPTTAFPSVGSPPWLKLGGGFNYLSHAITDQVMWQPFRRAVNAWRQETLGLPPAPFFGPYRRIKDDKMPIMFGYSPTVVPKPQDWPDHYHVPGYWFLPEPPGWQPADALRDFLDAGDPPVYIGFGSMVDRDPAALTDLVLTAVRRAGVRAVLSSGWAGLMPKELPADVYVLADVPHAWLFPRMAAVIHHGGAGTTAAGLRAGVPSGIVPFFADQHFWSQRVHRLGVGPQPVARAQLTLEKLIIMLSQAVSDPTMRQRAQAVSAQLKAEDGVGTAVATIKSYLSAGNTGEEGVMFSW